MQSVGLIAAAQAERAKPVSYPFAIPTMGLLRGEPPWEPSKTASP